MFYSTLTAALDDIANRSFHEGATVTPALSHCGSAVAYQPDSDRQEWFCPSCHRVSLPCSLTEGYAVRRSTAVSDGRAQSCSTGRD